MKEKKVIKVVYHKTKPEAPNMICDPVKSLQEQKRSLPTMKVSQTL